MEMLTRAPSFNDTFADELFFGFAFVFFLALGLPCEIGIVPCC